MGKIANDINSAAASAAQFHKELKDIGNVMDNLGQMMSGGMFERAAAGWNTQTGVLNKMNAAFKGINDSERENEKIEARLLSMRKNNQAEMSFLHKRIAALQKKKKLTADEQKQLDIYQEDLKVQEKQEIRLDKLKDPKKRQKVINQMKMEAIAMKAVQAEVLAIAAAFGILEDVSRAVYNWQNSLQKGLSGVARTLGSISGNVMDVQQAAKGSFLEPGGLGDLGYGLEEITTMGTKFAETMEWLNTVTPKQSQEIMRLGVAVGMSAQSAAEMTRNLVNMGGTAETAKDFMKDLATEARRNGITAAAMTKQFTGAGKALLLMTGPKAQRALIQSTGYLAKMGMSLDKLGGFTDKMDIFSEAATSIARINTAMGTHINALETFAEDDPAKRLNSVIQQLQLQGKGLDLSRRERKLLAESLGIEMDQVNAMLKAADSGKDLNAELAKQEDMGKERAKTEAEIEATIWRAKNALIAMEQVMGKVMEAASAIMEPFFQGMNLTIGMSNGFSLIENIMDKISKGAARFTKALSGLHFDKTMLKIGENIGKIFDQIIDFLTSDSMAVFIAGFAEVLETVTDVVAVLSPIFNVLFKLVAGLAGVLNYLITKIFPWIAWLVGGVLMAVFAPALGIVGAIAGVIAGVIYGLVKFWDNIVGFARWVAKKFGVGDGKSDQEKQEDKVANSAAGTSFTPTAAYAEAQKKDAAASKTAGAGDSITVASNGEDMPMMAKGGNVRASEMVLVGEKGPELFQPSVPGQITPNHQLSNAGQSNSSSDEQEIHIHVSLDSEKMQDIMYRNSIRRNQ